MLGLSANGGSEGPLEDLVAGVLPFKETGKTLEIH